MLGVVNAIVKHDPFKYEIGVESISVGSDSTCRTMITNDDDIQFLLEEDKVILIICVTLIKRRWEERVMGDDIQFNQNPIETRQSDNNVVQDSYEEVDLNAPHTIPHFDRDLEPQLDDRFDIGYGPEQHHTLGRRVEGEPNISSSNNPTTWERFLRTLKDALGHIDDLVLVLDCHTSIEVGIQKVFPNATHVFCIWHLFENLRKRFHRKDVAKIFERAARAYRQVDYDLEMEELQKLYKNAYEYVLEVGPHKWSRVYCPRRRFSMMTINVAECLNSCLRYAHKLLVMTLAEFTVVTKLQ
ncbi:hypothetical protein Ddye_011065 [Dipteronia dyeriana]|uniref:Transposase n=1 Tax=Dipteronia dyeriana TaxID=168575 RepID=A0AAD9XFC3_9ROSI|nr:hypothetical protein Ddye_011065 [Dipteronia dyeriana]